MEGFTENVPLEFVFLQLLMVLSEGRIYELTKMLMYQISLKTCTNGLKKV